MEREVPMELVVKDEQYQKLAHLHQEHEQLLHRLAEKSHLTEEEDFEEKRLKKEKLALKDQMEAILRRYRETATA
ncbi:MAG: DUF465 domain-containing protein [Thermoanaerobaculia bacterium]